jgi:hypothetical protein
MAAASSERHREDIMPMIADARQRLEQDRLFAERNGQTNTAEACAIAIDLLDRIAPEDAIYKIALAFGRSNATRA